MDASDCFPLKQLPAELLQLILGSRACSYLILQLWTCGDRILHSKLTSGITYINLKATWALHIGVPPVILKFRALRHLSLKAKLKLFRDPLEWPKFMDSLPSSLETLKLSSSDATRFALMNFAPDWTPSEPHYITTDHPLGPSRFIDMKTKFPRLHTLKLPNKESHPLPTPDLTALPSTLTLLKFPLYRIQERPLRLSQLPRSLQRLCGGPLLDQQHHSILWPDPPPALEFVRITIRLNEERSDFSFLPRSLTDLSINPSDFIFTTQLAATLPPNLATLLIWNSRNFDLSSRAAWFPSLPRTLTNLKLRSDATAAYMITLDDLKALPRSLRSFELRLIRLDIASIKDYEGDSLLPTTLTSLHLTIGVNKRDELDMVLRTLTSSVGIATLTLRIEISGRHDRFEIDPTLLPPKLTNLCLRFSLRYIAFTSPLPSSLSKLKLIEQGYHPRGHHLVISDFELLPRNLTELFVYLYAESIEDCSSLPQRLTKLSFSKLNYKALGSLSPNLTALEVQVLVGVPWKGEINFTELLPTSLTSLTILEFRVAKSSVHENLNAVKPCFQVSSRTFATLTRLKVLCLPTDLLLPFKAFLNLPGTLTRLEAGIASIEDKTIPFLPPFLEHVKLEGPTIHWNDAALGNFWPLDATVYLKRAVREVVMRRRKEAGV